MHAIICVHPRFTIAQEIRCGPLPLDALSVVDFMIPVSIVRGQRHNVLVVRHKSQGGTRGSRALPAEGGLRPGIHAGLASKINLFFADAR